MESCSIHDALNLLTSDMLRAFLDAKERVMNYATDPLNHFNYFVSTMLPQMVAENCKVNVLVPETQQVSSLAPGGTIRHSVTLSNVAVEKPTVAGTEGAARGLRVVSAGGDPLTPHEALLRGLTYSASVYVDVRHEVWLQPATLPNGAQRPQKYVLRHIFSERDSRRATLRSLARSR